MKNYTEMDFMKYSVDRLVRSIHGDQVEAIPDYIKKMPDELYSNYALRNRATVLLKRPMINGV